MTMTFLHCKNEVRRRNVLVLAVIVSALMCLALQRDTSKEEEVNRAEALFQEYADNVKTSSILLKKVYPTSCQLSSLSEIMDKTPIPQNRCLKPLRNIFEFEVLQGKLSLPETFTPKVQQWLGHDPNLFRDVLRQRVLHVYNKYTKTTTVYNPLRASRPLPKTDQDPKTFLQDFIDRSRPNCDLCNFKTKTAEDAILGRLETQLSASAANVFKLQDFHALIFPKNHNVMNLSYDDISSMFDLSASWFQEVHLESPDHAFPQMIFDAMEHAGASQPHPHLQAFIGKK